jgi:succinyl-CoA synthetase beta subunit
MDIEAVAAENPSAIVTEKVDISKGMCRRLLCYRIGPLPTLLMYPRISLFLKSPHRIWAGLLPEQCISMAERMGFSPRCIPKAANIMQMLYKLFVEKDATLVEINPMAESATHDGDVSSPKPFIGAFLNQSCPRRF